MAQWNNNNNKWINEQAIKYIHYVNEINMTHSLINSYFARNLSYTTVTYVFVFVYKKYCKIFMSIFRMSI